MDSKRPRRSRQDALRTKLQGHAHTLLGLIQSPIDEEIEVAAGDDFAAIEIHVLPPGGKSTRRTWLMLSPIEKLIVDKLRAYRAEKPEDSVLGKNLEILTGQSGSSFRAIVKNLVDRGVLHHDNWIGYTLTKGEPSNAD